MSRSDTLDLLKKGKISMDRLLEIGERDDSDCITWDVIIGRLKTRLHKLSLIQALKIVGRVIDADDLRIVVYRLLEIGRRINDSCAWQIIKGAIIPQLPNVSSEQLFEIIAEPIDICDEILEELTRRKKNKEKTRK